MESNGFNVSLLDARSQSEEFSKSLDKYFVIVKSMYPEWEIIDHQTYNREKGMPDFELRKDGKKFWIEVKSENDGIRESQLRWVKNNSNEDVKFLFIKSDYPPYISSKQNRSESLLARDLKIECPNCKKLSSLSSLASEGSHCKVCYYNIFSNISKRVLDDFWISTMSSLESVGKYLDLKNKGLDKDSMINSYFRYKMEELVRISESLEYDLQLVFRKDVDLAKKKFLSIRQNAYYLQSLAGL